MDNIKSVPRPEYPRPQLRRKEWLNLNGIWQFEIDGGIDGFDCEYYKRDSLAQEITVPFCPESELSGIGHKGFMPCVGTGVPSRCRKSGMAGKLSCTSAQWTTMPPCGSTGSMWANTAAATAHFPLTLQSSCRRARTALCSPHATTHAAAGNRRASSPSCIIPINARIRAQPAFGRPYGWRL